MAGFICFLRRVIGQVGRFRRDEGGTMAMMMGLAAVPLIFSVGAAVDYSSANMTKSKLDAVADTAALSAVDHLAISGTAAAAQITAQNTFNAEAADLANVTVSNVSATVTDCYIGPHRRRQLHRDQVQHVHGPLRHSRRRRSPVRRPLRRAFRPISISICCSTTRRRWASARRTADINKMVNNTPDQCAFACHDMSNSEQLL